jgi:LPXTG-site transpeptidase (sortase) family protein
MWVVQWGSLRSEMVHTGETQAEITARLRAKFSSHSGEELAGAAEGDALDVNLDICRLFVEHLVSDGTGGSTEEAAVDFDWDEVLDAADGSETTERAIGRMVIATYVALRGESDVGDDVHQEFDPSPPPPPPQQSSTDELGFRMWELPTEKVQVSPPSVQFQPDQTLVFPYPVVQPAPAETDGPPDLPPAPSITRRFRARRHLPSFFSWVRNIGALMILFVAWQLWGTSIGQHHAQAVLGSQFEAKLHSAKPVPKDAPLIPATTQVPNAPEGTVLASIVIPALGVSQYVVSGTGPSDLDKGPGHYTGTAVPGQAGNVAIAGHRTTNGAPFNRLDEMKLGDPIDITTTSGRKLTYVVSQNPVAVSPGDVAVLNDFGDNRLTLTTCTPKFSAAQRLVVVAELKTSVPSSGRQRAHSYNVQLQADASWNWGTFPVVLAELALLVGLGLMNRRLARAYGAVGRWLILTPIWIFAVFIFFQSLTGFLPSSI